MRFPVGIDRRQAGLAADRRVAESGREKLGVWQDQSRDIYADFVRAFGEAPGRITSIAIMTDTDNTGENVHAYYGDMVFKRMAPPRIVFGTD